MSTTARIGEILVARGAVSRDTLAQALASARGKLGNFLTAHNLVQRRMLAQSLAEQQGLTFVNFEEDKPDQSLFNPRDFVHYCSHHYIPFAQDGDRLIFATSEPSAALIATLQAHYRRPVSLVVTGPRDLMGYFMRQSATTRQARLGLRRLYKHLSADRTLLREQSQAILILSGFLIAALAVNVEDSWRLIILTCNLFYFVSLIVKIQLFTQGQLARIGVRAREEKLRAEAATLTPDSLPVYSILVPLYQESEPVLTRLIANIQALDYPPEKLDIKLVCEADDVATLAILKRLAPPPTMEIIAVPASQPRTKPKACNVALQHIRGEFLVIYDAEDKPAPDQLRKAVASFQSAVPEVACFQAALNYENRDENLLTQLFAMEYSALFRLNLPALERLHLPIPLGGTSNHLRVSALNAVGGWDAFNVTEDADLGIRLAYFGYRTRVLDSLTLEESPITLSAWMKQRTRWIKGYIQTWLVYMRDRATLRARLGKPAYYGFQFFVGAPALTFLLAPVFWAVFIVSLTGLFPVRLGSFTLSLCLISLVGGIASSLIYARAVLAIEQWYHLRRAMLVYPFYWLLHSLAAGLALYQLTVKPHYWAKTKHGVSRLLHTA